MKPTSVCVVDARLQEVRKLQDHYVYRTGMRSGKKLGFAAGLTGIRCARSQPMFRKVDEFAWIFNFNAAQEVVVMMGCFRSKWLHHLREQGAAI